MFLAARCARIFGMTPNICELKSGHSCIGREGTLLDFDQIRKLTIAALFSDDELLERLVLKGGNALNFVYRLT